LAVAHDAFISYSSRDKAVADAVCAHLEARRVRCWVAPRDLLPGSEYGAALVEAIGAARLLVLVLSSHSNVSPQVLREVERAVAKGLPILPLRIESIELSRSMEYFVSSQHWLDALTPPLESHLRTLADSVEALLLARGGRAGEPAGPPLDRGDENLNATLAVLFRLRVLAGPDAGAGAQLSNTRIVVGRSADCDLRVSDASFSRSHFALNWDAARHVFVLVDFGAKNGVLVNGDFVRGRHDLEAGDEIAVGSTRIAFERVP
jgi:hypothetical protein